MFEISWSELLILALVTLIFVGPKDLPKFLNTMGRYAGMVRRQAAEFRAQFDEAMRQAELDALKKEVNEVRTSVEDSVREAQAVPPAKPAESLPVTPAEALPVTPADPKPLDVTLPLGRSAGEIKASAAAAEKAAADEAAAAHDAAAHDAAAHDAPPDHVAAKPGDKAGA